MGEIKLCRDCRWVRPEDGLGYRYAFCAAPGLVSAPDPVSGERTMRPARWLREGMPFNLFGGWLAPCGTKARHFEPRLPTPSPGA